MASVGSNAAVVTGIAEATNICNNKTVTEGFEEWLNKGEANYKVYFGIKDDAYVYTGITKQVLRERLIQHNYVGKGFSTLEEQFGNLTRNQARAIEQYFIENGPNELNKINSIGLNNKYYYDAINWAKAYLGR